LLSSSACFRFDRAGQSSPPQTNDLPPRKKKGHSFCPFRDNRLQNTILFAHYSAGYFCQVWMDAMPQVFRFVVEKN